MAVSGDMVKIRNATYMTDCIFVVLVKENSINGPMYWCTLRKPGDTHGLYMHILEKDAEVIGHVGEAEFNIYKERRNNHGLLQVEKFVNMKYGE